MRILGTDAAAELLGFPARRSRPRAIGRGKAFAATALAAGLAMTLPAAALAGAFPAEFDLSTLDGSNGFTITGTYEGDGVGVSVSAAGDVNGDGFADIVVGGASAHVIFGTDQGFPATLPLSALTGANGFAIAGAGATDVAGAGDVNGDGIDDLVIGNYGRQRSHVLFGSDQGFAAVLDLSTLDGTNGFAVNKFNYTVSGAGDINGDGFADIIVGDRWYEVSRAGGTEVLGRAYVVFGSDLGFPALVDADMLDGGNGFAFEGIDGFGQIACCVSGAGDFNGDGIDDIVIGSGAVALKPSGHAFIVFGRAAGFPAMVRVSDLDGTSGFAMFGAIEGSDYSVSAAGDVNGDGIGDVIIGAPYVPGPSGEPGVGLSYVLFGARTPFPAQLDLTALHGANGFALSGFVPSVLSGYAVSGAGDINGDGIDDVMVGVPWASPGGKTSAGQSYVVFGSDRGLPPEMPLSAVDGRAGFALNGIGPGDTAGFDVSAAGDINGDGVDDIIVGAPYVSGPGGEPAIGQAYVVFGRRVPALTVSGACPGTVTVEVTRATPGATLGLVSALVEGRYVVPSGLCAGAILDLDSPALYTTLTADANGAAAASATVHSSACGRLLQVVDAATCTPGSVAAVP